MESYYVRTLNHRIWNESMWLMRWFYSQCMDFYHWAEQQSDSWAQRTVCIHPSLHACIYVHVHLRIHSLINAQVQEQCKAKLIKPIRKPPDGCLIIKRANQNCCKVHRCGAAGVHAGWYKAAFMWEGKGMKRHPKLQLARTRGNVAAWPQWR